MPLVTVENCSIQDRYKMHVPRVDWKMDVGEAWLVTGPNGGGKAAFVRALAGEYEFVPNEAAANAVLAATGSGASQGIAEAEQASTPAQGAASQPTQCSTPIFSSVFKDSVAVVSLEVAAASIEEERARDESEILDKEDIGRTGRQYICEVLGGSSKKGAPLPPIAARLDTLPEVRLCGVERILDRGLRYMSTGEIRRILLCRALLSRCRLLILSDPFAGLDAVSRRILLEFFDSIVKKQLNSKSGAESSFPRIVLSMERFHEIPPSINRVLEFTDRVISFCGDRGDYEKLIEARRTERERTGIQKRKAFLETLEKIRRESDALTSEINVLPVPDTLIRFENVNVGWGDHKVLVDLNWEVKKGVHWLIRGPNGSGKTTILELITGDNMQVFRENIKLFGKKRGTGETIWDIKKQLGIVSYRLHVEYRMVGGTDLQSVIISGFHDSIGLYEPATDFEIATAKAWLKLAGFAGRENETFSSLSYGEQRAVLIIRAAVKSPRVLILDEPCHGLDENYRDSILSLLKTIADTGTTTLLHVTHDPSEALECERHILELHPNESPMYEIIRK